MSWFRNRRLRKLDLRWSLVETLLPTFSSKIFPDVDTLGSPDSDTTLVEDGDVLMSDDTLVEEEEGDPWPRLEHLNLAACSSLKPPELANFMGRLPATMQTIDLSYLQPGVVSCEVLRNTPLVDADGESNSLKVRNLFFCQHVLVDG